MALWPLGWASPSLRAFRKVRWKAMPYKLGSAQLIRLGLDFNKIRKEGKSNNKKTLFNIRRKDFFLFNIK